MIPGQRQRRRRHGPICPACGFPLRVRLTTHGKNGTTVEHRRCENPRCRREYKLVTRLTEVRA